MALGITKPGQGYWTRVLTAVGAGVLALAGASYAWGQASTVRLPIVSMTFSVAGVESEPDAGDRVEILAPDLESLDINQLKVVGTGIVESYEPGRLGSGSVVVGAFSSDETRREAYGAERLRAEAGVGGTGGGSGSSGGGFDATVRPESTLENAAFPQIYLQAAGAGVVLVLSAIAIYWFVGISPTFVGFLVATDGEMKKVNWTSVREVRGSTVVVIVATFLIAALLFAFDNGFGAFFRLIGVLET